MDRGNKYLADILHSIELIELFTETIIKNHLESLKQEVLGKIG